MQPKSHVRIKIMGLLNLELDNNINFSHVPSLWSKSMQNCWDLIVQYRSLIIVVSKKKSWTEQREKKCWKENQKKKRRATKKKMQTTFLDKIESPLLLAMCNFFCGKLVRFLRFHKLIVFFYPTLPLATLQPIYNHFDCAFWSIHLVKITWYICKLMVKFFGVLTRASFDICPKLLLE